MQIKAKVIARAKYNKISVRNGTLIIHTTEIPEKGKANQEIIKQIADFYNVAKRNVAILHGVKSNYKLINVSEKLKNNFLNINCQLPKDNNNNNNNIKKFISRAHCWER